MATMRDFAEAKGTARTPCAFPSLETLEANIRSVRQAIEDTRHTTGQIVAGTAAQVQQHPLRAVALVMAAGALMGGLTGVILGWRTGARREERAWMRALM
jgi:hypothetical protein